MINLAKIVAPNPALSNQTLYNDGIVCIKSGYLENDFAINGYTIGLYVKGVRIKILRLRNTNIDAEFALQEIRIFTKQTLEEYAINQDSTKRR